MSQVISIFSLSVSLMISTFVFAGSSQLKVIYGDDNRVDVYDSENSLYLKLAKSTAAMISHSKLVEYNADEIIIKSAAYGDGMCDAEKFSKQPAAANCSGFLVGDKILVTAGHCMRSQSSCDNSAWVFDYKVEYEDQDTVIVDKSDVYKCRKIISQTLNSDTKNDYAVIELEKVVEGREPLAYRTSGKIAVGDELVVIGHPAGLPTKIADGAAVRSINDVYLVANLDTYGGNSGSAVFNATTGVIEGILVRGERDFRYNSDLGCRESNQMDDDQGKGEDVTLISSVSGLPASVPAPDLNEGSSPDEQESDDNAVDEDSSWEAFIRYLLRLFG